MKTKTISQKQKEYLNFIKQLEDNLINGLINDNDFPLLAQQYREDNNI